MYKTVQFNIFEENLEEIVYKNRDVRIADVEKSEAAIEPKKPVLKKIQNYLSEIIKGEKSAK